MEQQEIINKVIDHLDQKLLSSLHKALSEHEKRLYPCPSQEFQQKPQKPSRKDEHFLSCTFLVQGDTPHHSVAYFLTYLAQSENKQIRLDTLEYGKRGKTMSATFLSKEQTDPLLDLSEFHSGISLAEGF